MNRRHFLTGLASVFAAPAIVRAASLMPVKSMPSPDALELLREQRLAQAMAVTRDALSRNLYGDLSQATREAFLRGLYKRTYFYETAINSIRQNK